MSAIVVLSGFLSSAGAEEGKPELSRGVKFLNNESNTDLFRVIWTENPSLKATIGWTQKVGEPGVLYFGKEDALRVPEEYSDSQEVDRVQEYDGLTHCFVRLSDLEADTEYYFCIKDEAGVSPRFKFRTAPDKPQNFTFIAGGDSRNFREPRVHANMLCARLKPLFVAFTGDMINHCDAPSWLAWLNDWQHTIGKDGTMIPIVPHRGNHERRPESISHYFDTNPEVYFSFNVGGDLFRYYALNSEIPAGGTQLEWLSEDLKANYQDVIHLVAGYHKPMRPHVGVKLEGSNPFTWAPVFYQYGVDLCIESDSHVIKRTFALRPDAAGHEGFSIAEASDSHSTVYIGEGCWGAPLRAADDAKPWTLDCASFNGFDWIQVTPQQMRVKTVKVKHPSAIPEFPVTSQYETPKELELWEAEGGAILTIAAD